MKKIIILIIILSFQSLFCQTVDWSQVYYGDKRCYSVEQTTDGGYILGGEEKIGSVFAGGQIINFWVTKTDNLGNIEWEKNYGGISIERIFSLQQTTDGGYILGGGSSSADADDGDVSIHYGARDFWVVKIDELGNIEWEKSYGGSNYDELRSLQQTTDGGYILGGESSSSDENVSANYGDRDFWVVKIDELGNIEWEQNYGGSDYDILNSLQQTTDGGYILGGGSSSSDGNVSANYGSGDFWVVKIDNLGNIEWEQNYGDENEYIGESLTSLQQITDEGYILVGLGKFPGIWIVRIDESGNLLWEGATGTGNYDTSPTIRQTTDGSYILGFTKVNFTFGPEARLMKILDDLDICELDITISSQEEINNFATNYGCTTIGGTLTIGTTTGTSDISNLNALEGISSIGGDLVIQNNPQLSFCCPILCLAGAIEGEVIISNNGENCNDLGSINNECPFFFCDGEYVEPLFEIEGNQINQTIYFTDQSSGNPTFWLWNFGDGITQATQNPTHTYTDPGLYTVTLTISDGAFEFQTSQQIEILGEGFVIPLIFHVVHDGDNYGEEEHLSYEIIQDQILVLNKAFRGEYNPESQDLGIQFSLVETKYHDLGVSQYPNVLEVPDFVSETIEFAETALNVWSYRIDESVSFPVEGISPFPWSSNPVPSEHGIVLNYKVIGGETLNGIAPCNDKGRVLPHEVGHFFGLHHVWGFSNGINNPHNCTDDDYIGDTPRQKGRSSCKGDTPNNKDFDFGENCPSGTGEVDGLNFMDTSGDDFISIFTEEQKNVIRGSLFSYRNEMIQNNFACSENSPDILIPSGGEKIRLGFMPTNALIQWMPTCSSVPLCVQYTIDNGANWHIVTDNANGQSGSITWDIPKINSSSVKIRLKNAVTGELYDESDLFTITYKEGTMRLAPATYNEEIDLFIPLGEYSVGSSVEIVWDVQENINFNGNMKLYYSPTAFAFDDDNNGAGDGYLITENISFSDRSFTWVIPENPDYYTSQGLFALVTESTGKSTDYSNSFIKIKPTAPSINLVTENCNSASIEGGNLVAGETPPDGFTFQWYLNGELLEGENIEQIEITSTGEYGLAFINEDFLSICETTMIASEITTNYNCIGNTPTQPEWVFTETPYSHELLVASADAITVNGSPLENGDHIGVFANPSVLGLGKPEGEHDAILKSNSNNLICAGFGVWTGSDLTITMYGDDSNTEVKEGFIEGEKIRIIVWKASDQTEYDAVATYMPPGGEVTHTNRFANGGVSCINTIIADTCTNDPELDTDGDGLTDCEEELLGTNISDPDSDGDGLIDGEEITAATIVSNEDTDGDGIVDGEEIDIGTNPNDDDSDDDGLSDGEEVGYGTSPINPDSDSDGVDDLSEIMNETNPTNADTDGDGLTDGEEEANNTDPNNSDSDGDGLSDSEELNSNTDPNNSDSDGDGLSDGEEISNGTNPTNPDSDGDGTDDGTELSQGTNPNCDETNPPIWYQDLDGDGIGDPSVSIGSCEQPDGYVSMCSSLEVSQDIICSPQGDLYQIIFILSGDQDGQGYDLVNNQTGEAIHLDNPYYTTTTLEAGSGYSYTIILSAYPECHQTFSATFMDCTTTEIELLNFDGEIKSNGNQIYWSTASEKDSKYFTLERSRDGISFSSVTNINANENSNTRKQYEFMDKDVSKGIYYYRLLETDIQGRTKTVSKTISLNRENWIFEILSTTPIPAIDYVNIDFVSVKNEKLIYETYDVTGKIIASEKLEANEGLNTFVVNINNYPVGTYFLKIKSSNPGVLVTRFIKE